MNVKSRISSLAAAFFFVLFIIGFCHPSYAQTDACATHDPNAGTQMNGSDASGAPITIPDPPVNLSGLISTYPQPDASDPNPQPPQGAAVIASGLGGWGGNNTFGSATDAYVSSEQHAVANQENERHQAVADAHKINVHKDYCFDELKQFYQWYETWVTCAKGGGGGLWPNLKNCLLTTAITSMLQGILDNLCTTLLAPFLSLIQQYNPTTVAMDMSMTVNNLMCIPMPPIRIPGIAVPGLPLPACHGQHLVNVQMGPAAQTSNTSPDNLIWHLWKGKLNIQVTQ